MAQDDYSEDKKIIKNITLKEKAKELMDKFIPYCETNWTLDKIGGKIKNRKYEYAKQCALICVDDEIKLLIKIQTEHHSDNYFTLEKEILELQEVKQEIEKL